MTPSAARRPAARRWRRPVALAVALGGILGASSAAPPGRAAIPAAADTALHDPDPGGAIETAPGPLIVPGRRVSPDTSRSRRVRAREYLALGRRLEEQGQWVSAVAAYRNAILFDTTLTGVAFRMGQILASLGDDPTAVEMYATEVARNPRDLTAARELGLALSRIGQHDLAIRQLEMLTRRAPSGDSMWTALGLGYLAAGRPAAAESALRRAIALPPPRAAEHRDLAAALAARGRPDAARASYRTALRQDPADPAAWLNLGNLERDAGRDGEALTAWREAERRDSSLAAAIAAQARLLARLGRRAEADSAYRRWVASAPGDLGARLEAVRHFVAEDQPAAALEIASDALERSPRSPDAHLLLGVALDASGRKREALAALRRAESLFGTDRGRARARQLIAALRASAPDSLRGHFAADSAAHAGDGP